ncbi:MAG: class II aldolase/adducin family protein [Rhizomicrobium sp.]
MSEALAAVKRQMIQANAILLQHQVLDGFGHVSARHPERPDRFLLARRKPPGLVCDDDICEFDLRGETTSAQGAPAFIERYIHSAVYAARPDVGGVVHSHSPAMVAMGIAQANPLRAVCHTCGFLSDGVPLFEIRDVAGDGTDLLVRSRELGAALAQSLSDASVVLMRGHGSTVVGTSVPHAVYRAVYAEVNARVQTSAAAFGAVTSLTAAEARAAEATAELQVGRAWAAWTGDVES